MSWPMSNTHRRLITIPDAAQQLSISVRMVFNLVADGTLPVVRLRRTTRIDTEDLARLIEANRSVTQIAPPSGRPPAWPPLPYSTRGRRSPRGP